MIPGSGAGYIIYDVRDKILLMIVLKIGHRKDVDR
jgi:mRNA-degrading endonuclease RelE of RelBE toxin-antitoxin system